MKRHKMNRRRSERYFSAAGSRVHKKNIQAGSSYSMRGGIRL